MSPKKENSEIQENEEVIGNQLSFADLGLTDDILKAITQKGFTTPSEIQVLTIPRLLENKVNMIAQAQTGTGKTAAFGLPLCQLIDTDLHQIQVLILAPTRELAVQVAEEITSIKGDHGIKVITIYGGQSYDTQFRQLKKGPHIVVGTPGRVIDHLNRKTLKLDQLEHLILDEADEMLNLGFVDDMEEIMRHTNPKKRILLFSATMPRKIKDLAKKYMGDYEMLAVEKKQLTTNLTEQIFLELKQSDRFEALCRFIDIEPSFYGLIFCRTKNDVDELTIQLIDRGYDADAIHGDLSQHQRERTLTKFKKQRINILVATDVAARGIDVNNLTHVVNYAMPQDPESYVHRIGRTGRAGKSGTAITFINSREYRQLSFIEKIAKVQIKKVPIPKVEDIIKVKKAKMSQQLMEKLENGSKEIDKVYSEWAGDLLAGEGKEPKEIIAAILNYAFGDRFKIDRYKKIHEGSGEKSFSRSKKRSPDRGRRSRFDESDSRQSRQKSRGGGSEKNFSGKKPFPGQRKKKHKY